MSGVIVAPLDEATTSARPVARRLGTCSPAAYHPSSIVPTRNLRADMVASWHVSRWEAGYKTLGRRPSGADCLLLSKAQFSPAVFLDHVCLLDQSRHVILNAEIAAGQRIGLAGSQQEHQCD